jgi:hypothetical protein
MNDDALRALRDAVRAGKLCTVPSPYESPRERGETARIMGYAEGYAMMRHNSAMPFVFPVKDLLAILEALIAQQGAGKGGE